MSISGWTVCPGCGLALPDTAAPTDGRRNASAACWRLHGEIVGYESQQLARLGGLHQLTVDAYGAQHAGGTTPAIGTAFSLIGLRLALDDGWTGSQVRDAHRYLARAFHDWPAWTLPSRPAELTVFDVAGAGSPEAHAEAVARWAGAVWASWTAKHGRVAVLVDERLPPDGAIGSARSRLSTGCTLAPRQVSGSRCRSRWPGSTAAGDSRPAPRE